MPASATAAGCVPGSDLITVGSPRKGASFAADANLDENSPKTKCCDLFSIKPKEGLGYFKSDRVVVDQMNTWFDLKTLEVLGRNYALSYKAGVYDFDVAMEVEMTKFNGLTVPKTLRYKGNWDVVFKKRERAIFTATLLPTSYTDITPLDFFK